MTLNKSELNLYGIPIWAIPELDNITNMPNQKDVINLLSKYAQYFMDNKYYLHELAIHQIHRQIFNGEELNLERRLFLDDISSKVNLGNDYYLYRGDKIFQIPEVTNHLDDQFIEYEKLNSKVAKLYFEKITAALVKGNKLICIFSGSTQGIRPILRSRNKIPLELCLIDCKLSPEYVTKSIFILTILYAAKSAQVLEFDKSKLLLYDFLDFSRTYFSTEVLTSAKIDLLKDKDELYKNLRTRIKSHINWHLKNNFVKIVTGKEVNNDYFTFVRNTLNAFHQEKINKNGNKLSDINLRKHLEFCREGLGQVFLSFEKNNPSTPLAIACFVNNKTSAMYAEGGYTRKVGNKIPSYGLIWDAICHQKKLGLKNVFMETFQTSPISNGMARPKWKTDQAVFKAAFDSHRKFDFSYEIFYWEPKLLLDVELS